MSGEYDTDKQLQNLGTSAMAAVLLLLVAATGYSLLQEDGWTTQSTALGLLALFAVVCVVNLAVSGRPADVPARPRVSSPAAPSVPVQGPKVQGEATFTCKGVSTPLGESFDLLV